MKHRSYPSFFISAHLAISPKFSSDMITNIHLKSSILNEFRDFRDFNVYNSIFKYCLFNNL